MEPDAVGKRLQAMRKGRGLTLRALAALAGVPQSTLSQVESGARAGEQLRLCTVKRLCWALHVGIGEFAGMLDETRNTNAR